MSVSNPYEIITTTQGDKTFRASRRTAAHLSETIAEIQRLHPSCRLHVIQPCFNDDVPASAGTHDKDAVLDVCIYGLTWPQMQRTFRALGWAAWYRTLAQGFSEHIHMISLGYGPDEMVGALVPAQVTDYYNHALGLRNGHTPGSDPSWHPASIGSTIFNYQEWEKEQEDKVPYSEWPAKDKAELMKDIKKVVVDSVAALPGATAGAVWSFIIRKVPEQTARAAMRKAANGDDSEPE